MNEQPLPLKNWPHTFDQGYVFKRLGIAGSPEDQRTVREVAQVVYNVVATEALRKGVIIGNIFRSSSSRTQILFEWRRRILRLPVAVRNHVTDISLLSGALYKYLTCIHDELQEDFERHQHEQATAAKKSSGKAAKQPQTTQPAGPQPAQAPSGSSIPNPARPPDPDRFEYHRPFIVPNGDIQIIRADQPEMPIAIRVSDLLKDRSNPKDICPDGDWINIANIQFDYFMQNLIKEGYMLNGDTVWLCHLSLDQIDRTLIDTPQPGESRLTSFNLASTLLRTIREHWPKLRNPSPEPFKNSRRSPLPRPNLTIIVRSGIPAGGALSAKQPALARPAEQLGGNAITPNRRMEQVARYAAQRHAKTKRKRTLAEAEAGAGDTGEETELDESGPAAQRRRGMPKIAAGPAAGPSTGPPARTSAGPVRGTFSGSSARTSAGPAVGTFSGRSARTFAGPVVGPVAGPVAGPVVGPVVGPVAGPSAAAAPGPSTDPNLTLAPAGQYPPVRNDDEAAFLANLDPTMFNDEGLVGDDAALRDALKAFLEQNEWGGDGGPMEED
ncbi:uncharacterized protein N7500_002158 [Penicillium coprophilum]|uniref:uncharacterized protein n=1 Tax=Penicillium coprophilum TaxID=36646 RepID=UPI00239AF155|nr:uncharacterized protein N7500_002158 [Penicillium coprophilum]KAJ5169375.1 hypothetical protein N7500_002158 [Penicillium coprophilum]